MRAPVNAYWSGETVRVTKQGDRRITDHRLAATESGSIVCTAQDITGERTTASTQHGEFYFLFEGEDESAFYTLDHEGYVTRWNDRVEDVLGYSIEASLGTHLGAHLSGDPAGKQRAEELTEAAEAETEVTANLKFQRDDGSTFTATTTVVASYTSAGTLRGFGVVLASADAPTTPA
ncbi:PAS domain-containing protein [Halorubrum lacusprofundi]|uniref:PAS domain-containing protein n=1 Tax=Halorubrum lacusprofundi (strain ATCC 49239 / DSM 5036 / JCM 8891 / ACAM 34) TaxID=416348 RepID=B9LN69_HALLT|nr:PAS domain-containing protein [Halorubrum lacusprofundi]ACM56807.1 hypothetical protein Hlac_1214 [Halorubrum lacusprofundi ATCC 49239]MCG1006441.1 PAS domain-containing protein [Halorubrum lacusprofundi]